jgi:hypothetical protein
VALCGFLWRGESVGNRVEDEVVGRAHTEPLNRGAAVRRWDPARAAKREKVGF